MIHHDQRFPRTGVPELAGHVEQDRVVAKLPEGASRGPPPRVTCTR